MAQHPTISKMERVQTAVEQLVKYMKENFHLTDEALEMFEQAKQMEREQKKQFWVDGNNTQRCNSTKETDECFDNYYNETYGK